MFIHIQEKEGLVVYARTELCFVWEEVKCAWFRHGPKYSEHLCSKTGHHVAAANRKVLGNGGEETSRPTGYATLV